MKVAVAAETEVGTACQRIGRDLGVTDDEMAPRKDDSDSQNEVAVACNAVSARIDQILQQGASASLKTKVTPPQCEVQAEAEAACKAQCSGTVDPGYVKAHCQPGHLYGRCEGACAGSCEGTCNGDCEGQCAGRVGGATSGHCAGRCPQSPEYRCDSGFLRPSPAWSVAVRKCRRWDSNPQARKGNRF